MATNFYYVYALKDPRDNPAKPFYIGKGTGSRAYQHLIQPDKTEKYKKILDIQNSNKDVIIDILVDDLTELQALKLESELISAFGTIATGGFLANSVVPSGVGYNKRENIIVPQGIIEKAQLGLTLLKRAVYDLIKANPIGVSNSDTASILGLRSDYNGNQKDYLSYSILGLLLREKKIKREKCGNKVTHKSK